MTRREYERELARLIPAFAAEVQALYAELIGTARRRVEAAIATGNADEVIRLLGLGEDEANATFGALLESLRDVFILGGVAQAARLHLAAQLRYDARGTRAVQDMRLRFDARNERAVEYLRQNDLALGGGLGETARERVRQVIADGVQQGLTPAQIARRMPQLALTETQVESLDKARQELGDRSTPPNVAYLRRKGRDKRFDPQVSRAIKDGKPLREAVRSAAVLAYQAIQRKQRAGTIARTEITRALNAGRYEAVMQAVDAGLTGVVLRWMSLRDTLVRDIHVAMHGQERLPGAPFNSPLGTLLRFPGDVERLRSCGARRDQLPLLHGCWDADCSVMRGRDANLEVLPANP